MATEQTPGRHPVAFILSEDEMRHGVLEPSNEEFFDLFNESVRSRSRLYVAQRRRDLDEVFQERLKANRAYCGLAWFGCILEQELEMDFDGRFASRDYPNGYRPESPSDLSQDYLLRMMERKYEFGSQW